MEDHPLQDEFSLALSKMNFQVRKIKINANNPPTSENIPKKKPKASGGKNLSYFLQNINLLKPMMQAWCCVGATEAIAPMPLVITLVPPEMLHYKFTFLSYRMAFLSMKNFPALTRTYMYVYGVYQGLLFVLQLFGHTCIMTGHPGDVSSWVLIHLPSSVES